MNEENQSSSDNTTPRYRALVDGTGYGKGDVLIEKRNVRVDYDGRKGQNLGSVLYGLPGCYAPLFSEGHLQASPDFELVEEIKEAPKYTIFFRNHTTKEFIHCLYFDSDPFYTRDGSLHLSGELYQIVHVSAFESRAMGETVYIVDVETVQKRSKESRRLK